ncbi:MAG TPA: cupin domain-containing protein [Blastocatellia bacterium]|jgi:anti-sigma factor ChrR (cupin superfamily)|nr:cupin domain-containing protein [Blastocatellia bacterium]
MKHQVAPDEMIEVAASYALGALSQQEARAFENHLAEGCETCKAELESFEATLTALALAEETDAPSVKVRDELLTRFRDEAPARNAAHAAPWSDAHKFISIRETDGGWRQLSEGVSVKQLYVDSASGIATSLVRMEPGTFLPMHQHQGVEQLYIIEGDCNVCGELLGPGDYHRAAAGSIHDKTYTVNGTMFLLVAPKNYEVINAR